MSSSISFNPYVTTFAPGLFSISSYGLVQGVMEDDPAIRNELTGGILASTEALPMWSGVLLFENIPAVGLSFQGSSVGRAASLATATGFSVVNQWHHAITTPQSNVPSVGVGAGVNFIRFGTGARLSVQIDPALVSLDTGSVLQQVSWDFGSQQIVKYVAAYAANVFTAMSAAAPSGGISVVTATTTSAHGLVPGDTVTISGVTPTGYNGSYVAQSGTTGSTLVYNVPTVTVLGSVTTQGQINAGGGALPVKILSIQTGNSKTAVYNPVTGTVNYNNSGNAALILI
jgi:hypothetical protein